MLYRFRCDGCAVPGEAVEIWVPMSEMDGSKTPKCPRCRDLTRRLYTTQGMALAQQEKGIYPRIVPNLGEDGAAIRVESRAHLKHEMDKRHLVFQDLSPGAQYRLKRVRSERRKYFSLKPS